MKYIWLDCDPGHDDALAILLATQSPDLRLLGISTVHGNASAACTVQNALRCLYAFGAPNDILVHPGATDPLLREARHDPEIHGVDGLGGVIGLPSADHPGVSKRELSKEPAIIGMANAIRDIWQDGKGSQVSVISTGPMTNIALFVSVYPNLLEAIEQFVFMGGAVGLGNRSAVAEFNIICDPEAAQIVLNAPVPKTMIPLNVTHTAILTEPLHRQLLDPNYSGLGTEIPAATTALRAMLSTLVSFFAASYKSTFGFNDGPPLHDALTIFYVLQPELFSCKRYRVDVELHGTHTSGSTVVDIWNYQTCDDGWGSLGRNCIVAETMDVPAFFAHLFRCVSKCDLVSPLNE